MRTLFGLLITLFAFFAGFVTGCGSSDITPPMSAKEARQINDLVMEALHGEVQFAQDNDMLGPGKQYENAAKTGVTTGTVVTEADSTTTRATLKMKEFQIGKYIADGELRYTLVVYENEESTREYNEQFTLTDTSAPIQEEGPVIWNFRWQNLKHEINIVYVNDTPMPRGRWTGSYSINGVTYAYPRENDERF